MTRIANEFNTYFANIGNKLANEIPSAHVSPSSYQPPFPQTVSFFLFPTCSSEIEEEISNLNVNKASGPFSIPTKILKLLKVYISDITILGFLTFRYPARTIARLVFRYKFSSLYFFGFKVGFFPRMKGCVRALLGSTFLSDDAYPGSHGRSITFSVL